MLQRLPLTLKALIATVLVGMVTWSLLDHWQSRHIHRLFQTKLEEVVRSKATANRKLFDHQVKMQRQGVHVLAAQKSLENYPPLAAGFNQKAVISHDHPPPWLPLATVLRGLMPIHYVLLLGADGVVREIYKDHPDQPPPALLTPSPALLQLSLDQTYLTRIHTLPFLLTSAKIQDASGQTQAFLLLANPLDNEFLSGLPGLPNSSAEFVALLEGTPPTIIASNRPDLVTTGTPLKNMLERYLIAEPSSHDRGASDLKLQLVTFVSAQEFDSLKGSILVAERQQRLFATLALIFAGVIIILWMTTKIRQITNKIANFSQFTLGKILQHRTTKDEITLLGDSFHELTLEIVHIRDELKAELEERKRAEGKIRTLSQAVEQSPTAVMITDTNGCILYVNPSFTELSGYSAAETLGKRPSFLQATDTQPGIYQELWQTIKSGAVWRGEFHNQRKDGTSYWELNTISPIQIPGENTTHYLAIKEDISLRVEMETTLQQARKAAEMANRLKNDFLTNISHELRTPLNTITGCTDLLLEKTFGDINSNQSKYLENVLGGANRLSTLIDNLLDLSRVTSEHFILEKRLCNLIKLLKYIEEIMTHEAQEKGVEFSLHMAPNIPTMVIGDPDRIQQILLHVVRNAIKFTLEGLVTLNVTLPQTDATQVTILFSVTDTGIGIPEDLQKIIFDPFTQGDSSPSRSFEGSGLGLAVAKQIIDVMGGSIQVKSQVGQGSAFFISLPFAIEKNHLASPAFSELSVLVASKNPINKMLLKTLLNTMGFQVIEANHCQEVTAHPARKQRHLLAFLCLDCSHSPTGGLAEAQAIRQSSAWHNMPVIVLGSNAPSQTVSVADGIYIFTQPLQREQMLKTIRRTLADARITTQQLPLD